ncbi:ABC transporter permease [Halococcus salsus]|uniref:ABC transporter permease n=1 Tax=Halococcus salsus TaxID=2162894 RepID=UPI0013588C57|nr:ABC transporter permease [Halococcus salsus]
MTATGRVHAEFAAAGKSFLRRRTAVFFTFFFPVLLIVIFGVLVGTQPTGGGLFSKAPGYYVPAYLAVVVLLTPLSRVGSTVARFRDGSRFEKLATTPLTRPEWLLAHTLVNVVVIGLASLIILVLVVFVTGANISLSLAVIPFVAVAVALFCGLGALIGSLAGSTDGVIAASNAIGLPLLFLSETFISPDLLPGWFRPVMNLSPLTYFARGVRNLTFAGGPWTFDFMVLCVVAVVVFALGAYALPETD